MVPAMLGGARGAAGVLLVACAAPPASTPAVPAKAAGYAGEYRVDVSAPDAIVVTARFPAAAARKGLRTPVDWEGRGGLDKGVTIDEVKIGGRAVAHRVERWTLRAEGAAAGDWEVRWRVAVRNRLDEETEGFPIRADGYAIASGHALFLYPEALLDPTGSGGGRYRVEIAAPPGWPVTTTYDGAVVEGTDALRDGVVLAGDWRVHEAGAGVPLRVALRGKFAWPDDDLVRPLAALVAQTREFFGDSPTPGVTFVLAQWPSERTTIAHTVRGGVVLVAGPDFDPNETDTVSLLAHEVFHLWIGAALRHAPDAVYTGLWFREGLAAYYGVVLPMRAGQLPPERALDRLQEGVVNEFLRHPVRDAKIYDLSQWYWWDRRVHEYVPKKGALVAFLVDVELRTHGKSLDGFVRVMWERYGRTGRRTTSEDLVRELGAYAGRDWRPFVDAHVTGVEALPLIERFRAAGLAATSAKEEYPDFGLGWRADVASGQPVLENVRPDGAAHRAGCREGDVVVEYAVPDGRFDVEAAVTVRRGGATQTCRFFPDRKQRDILHLQAGSDAARALVAGIATGAAAANGGAK